MLTYKILDKYNEITHFCTDRKGGISVGNYTSFNLSPFSGDDRAHFEENKRILCKKIGIETNHLIIPYQTHGTEIREIDETFFRLSNEDKIQYLNGVDALFTKLSNVCIGVTTADCVPLIFFDPILKIIAVAHAGWRGTCARITEKTVLTMIEKFNCQPKDILVAIGPSISQNVYEVGKEVVNRFENTGFETSEIIEFKNSSSFLNLWKANQQSLEKVGILKKNIEISGICTFTEHEKFFSARRLGVNSGRMLSGILLRKV
jgi:polyphenol oxidase